jgi:hypothetical protein
VIFLKFQYLFDVLQLETCKIELLVNILLFKNTLDPLGKFRGPKNFERERERDYKKSKQTKNKPMHDVRSRHDGLARESLGRRVA